MGWRLLGLEEVAVAQAIAAADKARAAHTRDTPKQKQLDQAANSSQTAAIGAISKIDGALGARAAAEAQRSSGTIAMAAAADAHAASVAANKSAAIDDLVAANATLNAKAAAISGLAADVQAANTNLRQALGAWLPTAVSNAAQALDKASDKLLDQSSLLVAEALGAPREAGDESVVHAKRVIVAVRRANELALAYAEARRAVPVTEDDEAQLLAQRGDEFLAAMAYLYASIDEYVDAAAVANAAIGKLLAITEEHAGAAGLADVLRLNADVGEYLVGLTDSKLRKQLAAKLDLERAESFAATQKLREKVMGG